jgi:hypothetical protein
MGGVGREGLEIGGCPWPEPRLVNGQALMSPSCDSGTQARPEGSTRIRTGEGASV